MTAVEWLESKFSEFETIYDSLPTTLYEYVEQAKEMEKQQQDEFAIGFVRWYCLEALQNERYKILDIYELLEIYKKEKGL